MEKTYNFVSDIKYEPDGHRNLKVPVIFDLENNLNEVIDFIFDTGAYITVIARRTAAQFEFDKIVPEKKNIPLTGYAGHEVRGDLIQIPCMLLGNRRVECARVAVPYNDTKGNIVKTYCAF